MSYSLCPSLSCLPYFFSCSLSFSSFLCRVFLSHPLSLSLSLSYFFLTFFNTGVHCIQGWKTTTRDGVTRKRSIKRLKHTENLSSYCQKMSVNSRLKAIQIVGQRKAFYRQRIPEYSIARNKETVDIDILITFSNGDRKIMESTRITSRPTLRIRKWNQLSQFRWTTIKVIAMKRLNLATFQWWAKVSRESASKGPTVLHIYFCSSPNSSK